MNIWNRMRLMGIFIQLVRNPQKTELIFKAVNITANDNDLTIVSTVENNFLAHEDFRNMFESNYVPTIPSLEALSQLPENSFGYGFYQHMKRNNLDPNTFPHIDYKRPIEYISLRIYRDHDLWHTLLGYNSDIEDELALQAFGVAQFKSPIATLLIAGGLLHLLRTSPFRAVAALQKVVEGYTRGVQASFLLSERLHEMFTRPLDDVRRDCKIAV